RRNHADRQDASARTMSRVAETEPHHRPPTVPVEQPARGPPQVERDQEQTRREQRRAGAEERAGAIERPGDRRHHERCTDEAEGDRAKQRGSGPGARGSGLGARSKVARELTREQAAFGDPRKPTQRPPDAHHGDDQRADGASRQRHRRDVKAERRRADRTDKAIATGSSVARSRAMSWSRASASDWPGPGTTRTDVRSP